MISARAHGKALPKGPRVQGVADDDHGPTLTSQTPFLRMRCDSRHQTTTFPPSPLYLSLLQRFGCLRRAWLRSALTTRGWDLKKTRTTGRQPPDGSVLQERLYVHPKSQKNTWPTHATVLLGSACNPWTPDCLCAVLLAALRFCKPPPLLADRTLASPRTSNGGRCAPHHM